MPPRRIWLNHAIEPPPLPEAMAAVRDVVSRLASEGAPLASHDRRRLLETARGAVAALLGASAREVVFTSGGTEAANLAIKGVARARAAASRRIVTTEVEALRVLHPVRALARDGFEPVLLPVDGSGRVDPAAFAAAIEPGAALASVQIANGEVGTLQPLEEISRLARARGVPLHTDACAAAGQVRLDVRALGVDLLSLSASGLGGLPGAGALFVREGTRVLPLIEGGTQERGLRAGGENLLGIAALGAAAAALAGSEEQRAAGTRARRDRLEAGLREAIAETVVHGPAAGSRLPGHCAVAFPGAGGEALVGSLSRQGVEASTGSACAQEAGKPSHVLTAMGIAPEIAACSVLFSLGPRTSGEEVETAQSVIREAVQALRGISGYCPPPGRVPPDRPRARDGAGSTEGRTSG